MLFQDITLKFHVAVIQMNQTMIMMTFFRFALVRSNDPSSAFKSWRIYGPFVRSLSQNTKECSSSAWPIHSFYSCLQTHAELSTFCNAYFSLVRIIYLAGIAYEDIAKVIEPSTENL